MKTNGTNKEAYLHVRVPRALLEQARAAGEAQGMRISDLVRFLLRAFLRESLEGLAADAHFRLHPVPGVPAGLCSDAAPLKDEELRSVADEVMRRLAEREGR